MNSPVRRGISTHGMRKQASGTLTGSTIEMTESEGSFVIGAYTGRGGFSWSTLLGSVGGCVAAIPDPLLESELLGYAPGACKKGEPGLFQLANGGTIFFDETGRLSLHNLAKIIRIFEGGEIRSPGADRGERVDVRTLAATNLDLGQAVAEKRFLKDQYYRLAAVPLTVPLSEGLGITLITLYRKTSEMKEGAEAGRTNCSELAFQDGT